MSTSPPLRTRWAAAAVVVAIGASTGLAGCGGPAKPSEAALAAKLKRETKLQSFSDRQINCVAGVIHTYGDATSLNKYVHGKITVDQLSGSDKSTVKTKLKGCLQGTG